MTANKKLLVASAVVVCVAAAGAQINLNSNQITFRTAQTPTYATTHYGDLTLSGGTSGTGWGWLTCNAMTSCTWSEVWTNSNVYGNLHVYGTKNFVQPHPTDTSKVIVYVSVEAGEALTLARGTATTKSGQADIALPDHFSLVTSADVPVTVLVTPEKAPALLYVKQKSRDRISVAMKNADYSDFGDVTFSYQVTGVRDGFENQQVIRNADKINADSTTFSPKRKSLDARARTVAMQSMTRSAVNRR